VFDFYVKHFAAVNNWDLVDSSAPYIAGEHLRARPRLALHEWACSSSLWERRIAILATAAFIRRGDLKETFALSEQLLADKHDLIHKAVGWMLREAGKKDEVALRRFLKKHYHSVPRTALRYATERWPEQRRKAALRGEF
jgi:3-methyladenine DNA glycosylase AlkD